MILYSRSESIEESISHLLADLIVFVGGVEVIVVLVMGIEFLGVCSGLIGEESYAHCTKNAN